MKAARNTLLALCLLTIFANWASAQTTQTAAPQTFNERVFAVVPVGRFPADPRAFAGLTPRDQHDVLACRDVLMELLKNLQTGGDGLRYLARDFASQFKTTADVLASLAAPETSLLAAGISGFDFVDDRTGIELRFFMVVFSEGKTAVSEVAAVLRKTGSQWRVAGFD
ncbi:MAG: hypothetical protein WBD07_09330 [Vicinamibacterales bacterium]